MDPRLRPASRLPSVTSALLRAACLATTLAFTASAQAQVSAPHSYKPATGYVPDAATAIRIAVAVWEPIYGPARIAAQQPFHAQLHDGVWRVEGSLPPGRNGGVALAEIARDNGAILRVSHGK